MKSFPSRPPGFVARLIAQTVCECDGKNWLEILPHERDRYARIGLLAEDRVRRAADGSEGAEAIVLEPRPPSAAP
jgi:hypothetical protein